MDAAKRRSGSRGGAVAGVDGGATLVKLAIRSAGGGAITETLPAGSLDAVAERLESLEPTGVGLTGGGAQRLAARLSAPTVRVGEFEAWAAGARALLGADVDPRERFLLVSVGTGTSVMLVEPERVTRVGGTALGGGTIVGLGAALVGEREFEALAALAGRGDRRRVDLLLSDVYPDGDSPLPPDLNAASLAKLARVEERPPPADVAHGIMGLVGENVGMICAGLATRLDVERIVFGGSTLSANPALTAILGAVCLALGRSPHFPAGGQYAGALGALALGEAAALRC